LQLRLDQRTVAHLWPRVVVDMIPRRRGRILMTSSVSATQPTPYETTYGPSRAFVTCSPESLHAEVLEAQSRAWVNEEEG
jgi:uncharacterized protein